MAETDALPYFAIYRDSINFMWCVRSAVFLDNLTLILIDIPNIIN